MQPIRVAAIMEAYTVTGPAKNLLRFCKRAQVSDGTRPTAEVSIITFVRGEEPAASMSNPFVEAAKAQGVPIEVVAERRAFDRGILQPLRDAIDRVRPDVVQTHGVKGHFLLGLKSVRRDHRWIGFHHGYTTENLKVRLYNRLNRWSLPSADRVITVCTPFAESLAETGIKADLIHVLPNSIEPAARASAAEIAAAREMLGLKPEHRVLLAVGRFSSEKGHADLLKAFRELDAGADVRLVLVGDGLELDNLRQLTEALGLSDRVVFAGHHGNVRPFYAITDVFVLPSHSEGSPNVLLEAMEAGLPIVATAVGGVPDTVEHEVSAIVVARCEPRALAEGMRRLLSDKNLAERLARAAHQRVVDQFRPDNYRQALLDIYTGLVRPEAKQ